METKDWPGIMTVLWLEHVRDGKVIYREEMKRNVLHYLGENFVLGCLFTGGTVPSTYYLGLDARTTINSSDTMDDLVNEPFINGYVRQAVSNGSGFSISVVNGVHRASSSIVTFSASGGNWGPVTNIFLATTPNTSGVLISSAVLTSPVTVVSGDSVNMRMAMSLRYCVSP